MARGPLKKKIKKTKGQLRLKGISGIPVLVTTQDVKVAEGLATHGKKIKALVDAGVSEANARSNSAELCSAPGVLAALDMALEKGNANVDRIAKVVDEGLGAMKIVAVGKKAYQVADHSERRQFARLTAELRNWIPDKKVKLEHSGSLDFAQRLERAKKRARELTIAGTQEKAD